MDSLPWVDYVCPGEADETFPELLETLLTDKRNGTPEGVLKRGEPGLATPRPVCDMDSVAVPDLDDYFEQVEAAGFRTEFPPTLAVETTRGC